jgi:ribose transport system permease protein
MTTASAAPSRPGWRERLASAPWVWSYAAVLVAWMGIVLITGRGLVGTLTSTIALAPFLVLVAIGQMFVITLGNGHIDLSVASVIPLAAFVSTGAMNGGNGSVLVGFALALGCAVLTAAANLVAILALRIPPIVATLAVGLMLQSATQVRSGNGAAGVDPALERFTQSRVAGISVLAVACVLVAIAAGFLLHRTTYGRSVQAIGQKLTAAYLAGIPVARVIAVTYLLSASLAALSGVFLGAFSSPNLDLGAPYLLNSIAVVVLGGSLIAGGRSNVAGIWGASLFLVLLLTLLNVLGINIALQNIVKGLIIILVLSAVGAKRDA